MSYEKLGFVSGQTLKAEHLNHMEDGIANAGGADWNASEGEAGHVKNRTHYEETTVVNEPLNITWDGNTEGLVSVGTDEAMFYKLSDDVFSDEQLKLMSVSLSIGQTYVLADVWEQYAGTMIRVTEDATSAFGVASVRKDGANIDGLAFPQKGLYFLVVPNVYYATSLTTTEPVEHTKTVVHKLDKKYLPDDVGGSSITYFYGESPYLYWDEDLTSTVSKAEFLTAYQKGEVRIITASVGFICNPIFVNIANGYARVKVADTSAAYVETIEFNTSEYVVEEAPPV